MRFGRICLRRIYGWLSLEGNCYRYTTDVNCGATPLEVRRLGRIAEYIPEVRRNTVWKRRAFEMVYVWMMCVSSGNMPVDEPAFKQGRRYSLSNLHLTESRVSIESFIRL